MAAASPSPSKQAEAVFALYGLEPGFEIDAADLELRLRQASLAWHPDRFALQPEEQRLAAEEKMAEFNEAFPQLRDPARRAELLLCWLGAAPTQRTDSDAGPEFLMRMMELREEAEEVRAQAESQPDAVDAFAARMRKREAEILSTFGQQFAALPDDARTTEARRAAEQNTPRPEVQSLRRLFYELRYHQRTREQLQTALLPGADPIP